MTGVPSSATRSAARARLPDAPAVAVGMNRAVWLLPTGEVETLSPAEAAGRIADGAAPFVCHRKAVARRLGIPLFSAFDLLELYAFVRPARFCVPTIRGLADALILSAPDTLEQEAESLFQCARTLLAELTASPRDDGPPVARSLANGNWSWGKAVLSAVGAGEDSRPVDALAGLKVWNRLREWEDYAPPPPPDNWPVEPVEARASLVRLLGAGSEPRPQQVDYASGVTFAFAPRDREGEPKVVLAEAGTGVGKTLGYIAPAMVWVRKNKGAVWISTYTRNLQRQLDHELDHAYPDPRAKARKVVVRKGRENTFCLLNFDEAVARARTHPGADLVALGLVARWAGATRDGDMVGGDFPGWLADLMGQGVTAALTDTRGECIYSACRHYRKCFIERTIRKARRAEIVVANHALVMAQAALGGEDHGPAPRYIFDEGHHLFDAADSAFSLHLTGRETAELRRWLRGAEQGGRSRRRGLAERLEDLIAGDAEAVEALGDAVRAGHVLPGAGWRQRLAGDAPAGPAETFLALVRQQVYARGRDTASAYSLETGVKPPVPGLLEAARALEAALERLDAPLATLKGALARVLDDKASELDTASRQRIERTRRGLERRAVMPVKGWRSMLRALDGETPPIFVDWFGVERAGGRDLDVGFYRHFVDPMQPFAELVARPAHGVLVTSATLRDGTGDEDTDWAAAEIRTGVRHLASPPVLSALPSPFDYASNTRVLVVNDLNRDDPGQVAAAYRELFLAAGGGGLGLFTAVARLRAVHERIAAPLEQAGLRLLAQHVDAFDTGTLVDIFRAEENTCLLGTDAVRDGVDVPGRALRLIVFDRVPWPRPDILHRVRRERFGGKYDDMLTRLKLKQAYGRLVRRANDRGVFVMLDRMLPSRLLGAFPDGVEVRRVGLKEALAETRDLLSGKIRGEI